MPSRPSTGSWARFVVYGLADMKEFSNDFWFSINSGTVDPPHDIAPALSAFYSHITSQWGSVLSDNVQLRGCYGELSDGSHVLGSDLYSNITGSGTTDMWPEDVSVVVQKITSQPGRPGRGRWYFCGGELSGINGSYLSASGVTAWTVFAATLKTTFSYTGTTTVVCAPAHFSPTNGALYPIINCPVVALLGTRRRRRGPF